MGLDADPITTLLGRFMRRQRVPAVAATVVDTDGPVDVQVVGVRRRGSSDEARASDRWHIGSCTKTFTAVLWACLVEGGDAEWDMPLSEALLDLGSDIHPDWAGQTVDSALRCRGGFVPNLNSYQMQQAWADDRPLAEQRTDVARRALRAPPHLPGRFVYSNLGHMVVGAAIDRVAKAPFEQALDTQVLGPLGIDTAGFGPPKRVWGHPPRFQLGSIGLLGGRPADAADLYSDNPAVLSSAGTMHITVADWAKLARVFLDGGSGLLHPATVDHLLQLPDDDVVVGLVMGGWAPAFHLPGVSYAMQGSNTLWSATALIDDKRRRAALVACNDGRTRVLDATAQLAAQLLSDPQ